MEDTTIKDVLKTVQVFHDKKDYQGALKALESGKGELSPGLWHYNIGTIYGKLENWPLARFHLLMADEEGLESKELSNNISLVESKLNLTKLEDPQTVTDFGIAAGMIASQGIFTALSLILLISGIITLKKKVSLKRSLGLFFTALFILGINWWVINWNKMIVINAQSIKDGPSNIFESVGELPPGLKIVATRKGDWLKIIYPSRFRGWIKESGLKELK